MKRGLVPFGAALTSVGGCSFVATAWTIPIGPIFLGLVFSFVLVACLAGEAKIAKNDQPPTIQK